MKTLLVSAIVFMASLAFAEDTPFVQLLGYSANGQYMAFQEAIVADGSGNHHSTIRVLDTVADKYIKFSSKELSDFQQVEENESALKFGAFVERAQNKAKSILDTYGIDKSKGEFVKVATAPRISSIAYKGKYISLFKQEFAVEVEPERYDKCRSYKGLMAEVGENNLLGYKITASNADEWTGGVTLHEDTKVVDSRGCPQAYSINSAVAFGNKVVLFVSVKTFGFEGPDISFITVPFDISKL